MEDGEGKEREGKEREGRGRERRGRKGRAMVQVAQSYPISIKVPFSEPIKSPLITQQF